MSDPKVQELVAGEQPPPNSNHILIEPAHGRFAANGSVEFEGGATYFRPAPFRTLEDALAESLNWARANGVPVVYVRPG